MFTKIGTHNGLFQADDVFACALLLNVYRNDAKVVRTRDPEVLKTCDIVVDVGGEYNPSLNRFDHHQQGRAGARENGVLYSSFGLVWKHFGLEFCGGDKKVWQFIDETLVQAIDAADNGQALFEGDPLYGDLRGFSVSLMIHNMNPGWNEPQDERSLMNRFKDAMFIADEIIRRALVLALGTVEAETYVRSALSTHERAWNNADYTAFTNNGRGFKPTTPRNVLVLERFIPWQRVVIEEAKHITYVVFPDPQGTWMVQAVPPAIGSFEMRKPLPEAWAGLRDEEFQRKTDLPGAVFCHPGRFIAGAKTRHEAVDLARMALGE